MSGPVFTASDRTKRERAAIEHDGLCIIQSPYLSRCYCNCPRCWSKLGRESICEEVHPKPTGAA